LNYKENINPLNTNNMNTASQIYETPKVERIELDNEIALQLESTPPKAPGEAHLQTPECLSNDPFKNYA
jgi:hypothetical protein